MAPFPYEGRYDAILPLILLQNDKLHFLPVGPLAAGLDAAGEFRDIKTIHVAGYGKAFLLARNNGRIVIAASSKPLLLPSANQYFGCMLLTQRRLVNRHACRLVPISLLFNNKIWEGAGHLFKLVKTVVIRSKILPQFRV